MSDHSWRRVADGARSIAFSKSSQVNLPTTDSWALITPADLLRSIRHRLPSVILVTLVVTAMIVALLIAWPNRYRSDGLMYVRLGRGAIGVDPTTSPTTSVSLQESRTTEVVSVGKMIGSREIAERTVDQIGVEELMKPRTWIDRTMLQLQEKLPKKARSFGEMSAEEVENQIQREEAIRKVQSSLSIDVPRNGYTISVSAKAADPILAQSIARAVMDEYGRYHVEAHRANGSLEFFDKQNEVSRSKAAAAQVALQRAKNELGWMSPENAEHALRDRVISLEITLDETEGKLAEAQSRSEELNKLLGGVKEWIPMEVTTGVENKAHDDMRGQLFDLEVQENESLARIGPKHPRYRMIQEQVDSSSGILADQQKERELRREAVNPVHQELLTSLTAARAELAGLKSQRDSLQRALGDTREEIRRLNSDAAKLAELDWAAKIAERDYLEHSRRYDEARITHELDTENLSDVSIIQEASLNLKKASPSRALLAVIGAMLGLSLGLLQAVLRTSAPVPSETQVPDPGYRKPYEVALDGKQDVLREPELVANGSTSIGNPGVEPTNSGLAGSRPR